MGKNTKRRKVPHNSNSNIRGNTRNNVRGPANKNRKKKKKMKLNKFKFIRNILFLVIILIAILLTVHYFKEKAIAKEQAAIAAEQQQQIANKISLNNSKKTEFLNKENKLLSDLERYNQNLAVSVNYPSSVVNIYPDSLNAANSLKSNLDSYSQYLSSTELNNYNQFITTLLNLNTNYINSVITYNKNISLTEPNMNLLKSQKAAINSNYMDLNNFIGKNTNIFS